MIRLTAVPGLDPEECPAIVCCGGRWDVHGSPLSRTWVKLGAAAEKGSTNLELAEPVAGWKVGDRVILTAATGRLGYRGSREIPTVRERPRDRRADHPGGRGSPAHTRRAPGIRTSLSRQATGAKWPT